MGSKCDSVSRLRRFPFWLSGEPILGVRLPLGMGLCGLFGMLGGVQMVTVREMRMMSALLVVLLLMMLRRMSVMLCRLLVVLRGLLVMLGEFC